MPFLQDSSAAPRLSSGPAESVLGAWTAQTTTDWGKRTALLVGGMALFRAFILGTTELTDTEAYYLVWSRFGALSYYDHPPLVAWMARLTTFGSTAAFAARLGPVLCSVAFGWLLYRLAARLFSDRAAFIAVAIVSLVPAYYFTGFLLNPEVILAPLWVLFLLLLDDLQHKDEAWRPAVLGLVIGVGFLAKYTAILAVPVTLLVVIASPKTRRWLWRPSFYYGGLMALLVVLPVLWWNHTRHWPSLALHLVERVGKADPVTLGAHVVRVAVGQLLLFHPLVLPGFIVVLALTLRRALKDSRYLLLAAASTLVLLVFLVIMVRVSDAEPHWTMVGYMPLAVAAGGILDEHFSTVRRKASEAPRLGMGSSRLLDGYLRAVIGVSMALGAAYLVHTRTPVLLKLLPASLYNPDVDPINETLGWDRVKTTILEQANHLGPAAVVASSHNVLCGHVATALNDAPPVYCPSPRRTAFDFFERRDPPPGVPVVYVDTRRYREDIEAALPGWTCSLKDTVGVARGGRVVNEFYVHGCLPRTAP